MATKQAETYDCSTPLPNPRQELFSNEYLIDANGQRAYISAGYKPKGAHVAAHRMLNSVNFKHVQDRIAYLQEQKNKKARKTAEDIERELERIAFSDVTNTVEWNESGMVFVKSSEEISPEHSAAIESIEVTERAVGKESDGSMVLKTKVKHHNKLKAIELLGKQRGMFMDKVEHSGSVAHTVEVVNYSDKGRSDGNIRVDK